MRNIILGISAFYHDSAAALIIDGRIIAAAQEERFTRIKQDAAFPVQAIKYVLSEAGVSFDELTAVAFYDKPLLKFERLLETYHAFVPRGWRSFIKAMPVWMKEKIFMKKMLRKEFRALGATKNTPLYFPEHHLSHAASAFYPSPYENAAILTVDGVGEWATTTISYGRGRDIKILRELRFPHSPGLLYAAFTYFLGFKVNSGEYKLMGLSPYGIADDPQTVSFREKILTTLVDIRSDGSILLNMDYFDFATGLKMTVTPLWEALFGISRREPESEITTAHMNLALAIQQVTEEIVVALARTASEITGSTNLVMAGGVALNCVANRKIKDADIFKNIWIQPAAGDAGGSLGAAYAAYHIGMEQERIYFPGDDAMQGSFLGPAYSDVEVKQMMARYAAVAAHYPDITALTERVSAYLAAGKIVGWFQDRMEFGPRALGNRSILADPRQPDMQQQLNLKIKFREGFRPFAPAVLAEDAHLYFKDAAASPYMLFTTTVKSEWRIAPVKNAAASFAATVEESEPELSVASIYERLQQERSAIPAVTHLDHSARIQTVHRTLHPKLWALINSFKKLTGCSLLINTSFNVRGEPVVNTPEDAWLAFMRTEMDYVVIGNYVFEKSRQPTLPKELFKSFEMD
ncbi:carbamoyltransferase family protein [Chitinophaga arvensicola]|uniref:Carbamoyltransferase n=1 Tax=Chitinophaga arvensicola TaxID=29529 RepID=A0A1I0S4V0_9BACT|nr:carbamoyltransferase [Chitinophaga arvensicola]SEW49722.1 carbamoyltransferase [Chitinophaga arvensicola]